MQMGGKGKVVFRRTLFIRLVLALCLALAGLAMVLGLLGAGRQKVYAASADASERKDNQTAREGSTFHPAVQYEPAREEPAAPPLAPLSQGHGGPDIITVCLESMCAPYTNVQAAVSAIAPGGIVKVAGGVYEDTDGDGVVVEITKTLTLQGGYTTTDNWAYPNPETHPTELDGQGTARVVSIAADAAPTVPGFRIHAGSADTGAGVYVAGGSPTVQGNRIYDNAANTMGCGLYIADGSPAILNNLFYFNHSDQANAKGGGIYVAGGSPLLQHNTFYSNTVDNSGNGGGIYVATGSTPVISATIIVSNAASSGGGIYAALDSYPELGYNDLWGNAGEDTAGVGMDSITIFTSTNPLFVDPVGGDFRLAADSPCVDQVPVTQTVNLDYEGHGRPFGKLSDIGAHERYYTGTCFARLASGRVYTTVQSAVDAASSGDEIEIAGTCTGVEEHDGLIQTVYVSQALTLRGGYTVTGWSDPNWDIHPTVLDAQGQGRVVYVDSTDVVTVEGFHIRNAFISGTLEASGGGIYLQGGEHVVRYNEIYSNAANHGGGGMYVNSGARVHNNDIYSNTAEASDGSYGGGGIYIHTGGNGALVYSNTVRANQSAGGLGDGGGGICVKAVATIWENAIYDNDSDYDGGGIYVRAVTSTLRGNHVYSNTAYKDGGGICVDATNGEVTLVDSNEIYSNAAGSSGYGGGIYTMGSLSSGPTIQRNVIRNNAALGGGGVYASRYSLIQDNDIHDNSAADGGGIASTTDNQNVQGPTIQKNRIYRNSANNGGGIWADKQVIIANNLIYDNTDGSGIYLKIKALVQHNTVFSNTGHGIYRCSGFGDDVPIIRNNVVVNNTADGISSARPFTVTYCDSWGNGGANYGGDITAGTGTISADPKFVNPGTDFHLQSNSPCIDSADPDDYSNDDYDDVIRPIGARADMGAYEFHPGTCFARIGDAGQVYTDVQIAVNTATAGAEVRVAGLCQGTAACDVDGATISQTVYISKALSLHGGYTLTNWTTPSAQSTLDALGEGRAVYITNTSAITVDGFTIRGGQAITGGGMYVASDLDPTIQNVVFYSNSADYGGGFCSAGGNPRLYNNSFVSNTATEEGGAIHLGTGSPVVSNTIVVNNAAPSGGGLFAVPDSTPALAYNDVWQNSGGNYTNVSTGTTDLHQDPRFVDPAAGDFHLQADSPCIHQGDPGTGLVTDFEGDARPLPATAAWYDIGADESIYYPDVDFEPHTNTMFGTPGIPAVHTHFITNSGSISNVYVLHHQLITEGVGTGWDVDYTSTFTLAAGERARVPVILHMPTDAISNTTATIIVTATSQSNDAVYEVVRDETLVNWNPGIQLTPTYTEHVNPGVVKTYKHTLANTGNADDTFLVKYSSSYGWSVVTPTQSLDLGPGMTTTLWVTLSVPATAPGGLVETLVITASSTNPLNDIVAAVTDTTEVNHTTGTRFVAEQQHSSDELNNCLVATSPCRTIGQAVDQAVSGDVVKVAEGTYTEHNLTLNKNITLRGGYFSRGGGAWQISQPEVRQTIVDAQGMGRVFYIFGGPTIEGFTITGGETAGSGGGFYIYSSGEPIVRGNVISGNVAGAYGGGIYSEYGNPTLEQNVLAHNTAKWGGGFASAAGSPGFWSNTVYDNIATADGGGVYVAGGNARIWHETIYGNTANQGGGIYLANGSNPSVKNTIVAKNTAMVTGGGIYNEASGATLDYNDVWNNTNGDYVGATPGDHSISEDPDFVHEVGRDFHIWGTSPCVNEGDLLTSVAEDFEGQPRAMGPGPDIGADEHGRAGVELEADQAQSGDPSVTLTYNHTVTNTGNHTDTFSFDAHSSLGWGLSLPDPVEVGPGDAETVVLQVEIAEQAIAYTVDTTVLTATSAMRAEESDTVVDTTTVNRIYGASWKG